jgi:hypothetical protein
MRPAQAGQAIREWPRKKMKDLSIYLNDHLAGSVSAVEMVRDLAEANRGSPLEQFLRTLCEDIEADQRELTRFMQTLGIDESKTRKAGGWMAEKASRLKLLVADFGEPNLALLQALEVLSLGITGKRQLWQTLENAIGPAECAAGLDLARLGKRASEQFDRVEEEAFNVAREIFPRELDDRE